MRNGLADQRKSDRPSGGNLREADRVKSMQRYATLVSINNHGDGAPLRPPVRASLASAVEKLGGEFDQSAQEALQEGVQKWVQFPKIGTQQFQ
jgi:hypothetical protein